MIKKKSFTSNPALAYISTPDTDSTQDTGKTDNTHNTDYTHNTHDTDLETKSKRLNLLVQPSVLEQLKKVAYMKQTSANDLINTIVKDYIAAQTEAIEEYGRIFKGRKEPKK